ncbi:MAG: integrase core domain-containing protein, partial [Treponema sp.]|nr:integrase core domain-containing protein [Treponema sp.]MBQ8211678.1 integrase core domain-containing protein [Treponema sp.]
DSFDNLKDELQGYSLYYNEYRPHSSLDGITPFQALDVSCN